MICVRGPGPRHARRAGRVLGPVGPHRAAPVRAADRGPPRDHAGVRPEPDHRHLARRLHVRQAAAVDQPAPRADHPARTAATRCSRTATSPTRASPTACARRSTGCGRCTTRRSWRSTAACPTTRSSTRTRWCARTPRPGERALFVNDNYTRHFDGWSIDDSQPLLDHLYAQFARFEYTWRHRWQRGRPAHLGQPLRAARGGRRHRRPGALAAPHHDRRRYTDMTDIPWIVSLDDHVVEPPDVWTSACPAKYRDVGPHVVMAPAGHADPRRRRLPRGARHRGPRRRLVVLRGPAVLGEAPHRRRRATRADEIGFDGITFDQMRPGCWQPQARLDDMTMNHVEASLCFPNYPRFCGQIFLNGEGQGARRALRRGVQRLAGRRVVRGQQRPADPAVPGAAVGRRARRRRGAPQRGARRARGRVLRAARRGSGSPSIHSGYWDPFFAACAETGTVVGMHIGSGTKTITSSDGRARRGAGRRTSSPTARCR